MGSRNLKRGLIPLQIPRLKWRWMHLFGLFSALYASIQQITDGFRNRLLRRGEDGI